MKIYTSSLILIFFTLFNSITAGQTEGRILFKDEFKEYHNGSDGTPVWHPVKGDWQIVNGTYLQQSAEYDCASLLGFYLNESFEIEVVFEHIDGDPGAGFIFSSRDPDKTGFSHMVRFDGNQVILAGYFQYGEFTATSSVKIPAIFSHMRHRLILSLNRDNNNYSVFLDSTGILTDVPLTFLGGYCGLQSSGGSVKFHSMTVRTGQMRIPASELNWAGKFTLDEQKRFIVPDETGGTIRIFDRSGTAVGAIGTPAEKRGQLHRPCAVALNDNATLYVADAGSDRLLIFGADGKYLRSVGGKGKGPGQFDYPVGIAFMGDRHIFVLEKNNNRVQIFDSTLQSTAYFGGDHLREPCDIAIQDSFIFIINTGLSQIEIYRWTDEKAVWYKSISYGGGEARGIAVWKDKIYLSVVNQVKAIDTTGNILHSFRGRISGYTLPQGIVVDSPYIYISDYFQGRIIQTDTELLDPEPMVIYNDTNITISWESLHPVKGKIQCSDRYSELKYYSEENTAVKHHALILNGDLSPGTSYAFNILPGASPLPAFPPSHNRSARYTFTSPLSAKTKHYSRLPMATIIFSNVTDDKRSDPSLPVQPELSESEIERIKDQIEDGIRFYWIHSGMNLFLDNKTFVIQEPLKRSQLYGDEWWYPPKDSVLNYYLRTNGSDIGDFSGFLYLTCTQQYDTSLKKYVLAGKGGAFTSGVGTGKGYGISWWDATKENHNAGNNWLMVHEFNHQLDDIFLASGYPEYWFNHISPTIGTAARFGEHFDANSYILQIVPKENWYDLKFTRLAAARDADEDGIPDNDRALPTDEVRLGSDSAKSDTDDDGVSDFNELRFSNWLSEGWGETYGNPIFPALNHKDSDNDGADDRRDPYPCYRGTSEISYRSSENIYELAELSCQKTNCIIKAGWDNDSLYIEMALNEKVDVKLMIDGNYDGWFLGRENLLINLITDSSSALRAKVDVCNATNPRLWPFMDLSLSDITMISASLSEKDDIFYYRVSVPKNDSLCFAFHDGKIIGLSFSIRRRHDKYGNERYLALFEPNRFIGAKLVR